MFMVIFPAKASDRAAHHARHASRSVPGAVDDCQLRILFARPRDQNASQTVKRRETQMPCVSLTFDDCEFLLRRGALQ